MSQLKTKLLAASQAIANTSLTLSEEGSSQHLIKEALKDLEIVSVTIGDALDILEESSPESSQNETSQNDDLLAAWSDWKTRNPGKISVAVIYPDGSGEFSVEEIHGPIHEFTSLEHLAELLRA